MSGIYLIFDYFKEAFHLNKNNKVLYKPQIVLIVFKSLMMLTIGLYIYKFINEIGPELKFEEYFSDTVRIFAVVGAFILMILLYVLISRIIEAGLYNMYKSCVTDGEIKQGAFGEGVRKYFFKFLFGDILIAIAWGVCLIPYLLLGLITLSIGFAIIPLLVNLFLTMWKVSLVMNDSGIIESFGDSYRFAKANFGPLAVLQLINWSFTGSTYGVGRPNFNSLNRNGSHGNTPSLNHEDMNMFYNIAKVTTVILVPVITIATVVASVIKMIFDIFFSIALFIAYKNKFEVPIHIKEEVQNDVV